MVNSPLVKTFEKSVKRLKLLLKKTTPSKRVVVITGISLAGLVVLYSIYVLAFTSRVYPNTVIGDVRFGGMKMAAVKKTLTTLAAANKETPAQLNYQDKVTSIIPGDISWQLNTDATAAMIMAVGRNENLGNRVLEQLEAPFHKARINPTVSYDSQLLTNVLTNITETIDEPAVDASARFVGDKFIITHEKVGKTVNRAEVEATILGAWAQFHSSEIRLETAFDAPKVVVGDETELRASVANLQQIKVTLKWPGASKNLTPTEVGKLIGFTTPNAPTSGQQTLHAAFTAEAVKSYLSDLANTAINVPAKDPKLIIKDGVLAISQASAQGKAVDVETSTNTILQAIQLNPQSAAIDLTLKTQEPIIKESNLAELGIKELIGRGETSFAGSPANRKVNISNGVSLLSSALIKPGDEFSTVKTLGAVDNTTGFLPELVIKENHTTPEFGGGLCQVSTTLFRSVMNAGLKVTERQNHSYRVSYYEPPIGLDATIYLPKPDFKFLNDTPGYILIQGQVIGNKVIFELWGSKDGRTSSISTPIVTNITEPPDPIYSETDTLPKGTTKQIEHAHQGATAVATYTVYRNGQVINKQTFKSIYKPWQAQFLVGTHEDNPPAGGPPPTP